MLWGAVDMCIPVTQQSLEYCNFLPSGGVWHYAFFFLHDYTLHIGIFIASEFYSMQQLDCIDEGVCLKVVVATMELILQSILEVLCKFHQCIYTL